MGDPCVKKKTEEETMGDSEQIHLDNVRELLLERQEAAVSYRYWPSYNA
jgi:hypothetical protein